MIRVDQYTVLNLEEYKGGYELVEGWENRDGIFKPNWIKEEIGKKGEKAEKTLPKRVKLGDRETAASILTVLLAELVAKKTTTDDDAPF